MKRSVKALHEVLKDLAVKKIKEIDRAAMAEFDNLKKVIYRDLAENGVSGIKLTYYCSGFEIFIEPNADNADKGLVILSKYVVDIMRIFAERDRKREKVRKWENAALEALVSGKEIPSIEEVV